MSSGPPRSRVEALDAATAGQVENAGARPKDAAKEVAAQPAVAPPSLAADAASTAAAARIQQAVGGSVSQSSRTNKKRRPNKNDDRKGDRKDGENEGATQQRRSEEVRPKERSSIAPPEIKNQTRRTEPAIPLEVPVEPKEVTVSTSFNSIGALNWNVTGTPNGADDEDDEDDWSINDVIFAMEEKPEEQRPDQHRHRHRPHRHHDHDRINEEAPGSKNHLGTNNHRDWKFLDRGSKSKSQRDSKAESRRESSVNALLELEKEIDANPMVWNPNPEEFGFKKIIQQTHNNHADTSLTWSAPGDLDLKKEHIQPSSSVESIDTIFDNMKEKQKLDGDGTGRNTEDVESIISTEASEIKTVPVVRKGANANVRKRLGLAFVGVAMVCGVAGIAFAATRPMRVGSDPNADGSGDDGIGGSGQEAVGRSGGINARSVGCPDPIAILASSSLAANDSNPKPKFECSAEKDVNSKYKNGTICWFSCTGDRRLEGPSLIRCCNFDKLYHWCQKISHVESSQKCQDVNFERTPSKCVKTKSNKIT